MAEFRLCASTHRARTSTLARPSPGSPQLKRDPLGSMPMRIQPLLLTTAMLAATATDTTYAQRPRSISGLPSWALDTVGRLPPGQDAIRGVALNMTDQQVRSHLGVPDSVVKSYSEVIDSTTKLYYPNITVLLSRHGVEDIACSAVTCRLPNGIGVGSTLAQVVRALGRGHPGYRSGPSHSLFYYPVSRAL